jgi:hypothetical protein
MTPRSRVAIIQRMDSQPSQDVDVRRRRRQMALRMWLAFDVTMLALRGLTYGQKSRVLPVPDAAGGGVHIHHFVWGILILGVVAFTGLMSDQPHLNTRMALLFGIGLALVADEFALWLTLSDVYFASEGAWSVELAGLLATLLGSNAIWPGFAGRRASRGCLSQPGVIPMAPPSGMPQNLGIPTVPIVDDHAASPAAARRLLEAGGRGDW